MSSVTKNRRFHWILISVLLFLGIFPSSVVSRRSKGDHIPQRAASRAIGAQSSLTAANRDERPSPGPILSFIIFALLANLFSFRLVRAWGLYSTIRRHVHSTLWPLPLLFRPPPVSVVA